MGGGGSEAPKHLQTSFTKRHLALETTNPTGCVGECSFLGVLPFDSDEGRKAVVALDAPNLPRESGGAGGG